MGTLGRFIFCLAVIGGSATFSGPAAAQIRPGVEAMEGVAAIVNDEVISFYDVRNRARLILLGLNIKPSEEALGEARGHALRILIDERLQIQEAGRFELEASKEELDQQLASLAERNQVTTDSLLSDLANQGVNPRSLREQIRAQIVWQRLIGGLYGRRVRVSEQQIEGTLDRLSRSLQTERFHVAEILLEADTPDRRREVREQADTLREQIVSNATPFQLVAQQYSDAPSASSGGNLGWVSREDLNPELLNTLEGMKAQSVSQPIETDDGIYLIALLERRAPASETEQVLHLGQVASFDDDASTRVDEARDTIENCEALTAPEHTGRSDVVVTDLGRVRLTSLSEDVREAVSNTETGAWTEPVEIRGGGRAAMLVCARMSDRESALPDRQSVENSLFESRLSRLSARYLRDLRREAAIIRPGGFQTAEAVAAPAG